MGNTGARVAMVSMHTSPVARAGSRDSGGMNVVLLALAGELAARGVEVDLLTRAEGEPAVSVVAPGVTLHEIRAGAPGPIPKAALSAVSDEFGEAVAHLGRSGDGFDVIHSHYWLSGIATLPVSLELGIPLVQSFHTIGAMKNRTLAPGQDAEPELRLRSEMFLAGQASAIIAGSAAEATSLIDDLRAPAEKVWLIPPGVDAGLFSGSGQEAARARASLRIPQGVPIIAVAGRIQPLKDQGLAIRVLAELHGPEFAGSVPPVLVIAGDSTPGEADYLDGLVRLAEDLGVAGSVRFVGALTRSELAGLFAAASATLVPSHSETFGLVALESASSGTPVVGSSGTGLRESIADGLSGTLLDSREPREWAAATDRILSGAMSATARLHAEDYTWSATAAATLAVYASVGHIRV